MPPASEPDAPARLPPRERFASLLKPLLIGLLAALLALAFAHLGSEVLEGETRSFDVRIARAAQALRASHPSLGEVMRDLSGLGSTTVLTVLTIGTVAYLALFSSRIAAVLVTASIVTGSLLIGVLKTAFGRVRPEADLAELIVEGLSFPSGHATGSAIVFLTLGALVASTRGRWGERAYVLACSALMAVLVGVSRVVLGVHWATDVLAGWAFGAAWAIAWLLLERVLVRARTEARLPRRR